MKPFFQKLATLLLFLFMVTPAMHADTDYDKCRSMFEEIKSEIQDGDYPTDALLLKLAFLSYITRNLDLEIEANQRLFKNILTLRGNLDATTENFMDLTTTAVLYSTYISEDDETLNRFNSYLLDTQSSFANRMSGAWVCSHPDMAGAPMMVFYVNIDEDKDDYKAIIDPRCNLFNSKAYANGSGPASLYITEGIEYTPSKKRMKITFMDGQLKKGNTELAKSISDSFEKTSRKTTEGVAIANRNKPLSGKNIGGQTISESLGRIGQGIARELAVTKIKSYRVEMELYELFPGVVKVHMDYYAFVNRSDGDSYLDDFARREFYMYKVNQNDMGSFWSKYGQVAAYGHDPELETTIDKVNANRWAWKMLSARNEYFATLLKNHGKTHSGYNNYDNYDYSIYNGKIVEDIANSPTLTLADGMKFPFPVDKETAVYYGSFKYKKDVDFFDSPIFLLNLMNLNNEDYQDLTGVHYRNPNDLENARNKDKKKFFDTLEPNEGSLYYYQGYTKVCYEGSFKNAKFEGEGVIKDGDTILQQGIFKNGKLQK